MSVERPPVSNIQKALLLYIDHCQKEKGRPPSIREMTEFMPKSQTTTYHHLGKLKSAGYVTSEPKKARTVCVRKKADLNQVSVMADDEKSSIPDLASGQ